MLEIADWLIDFETRKLLTPADYMMITLSIYLHDLGMLVTREEFDKRHASDFPSFRESFLVLDESSEDYNVNLNKIYPDDLEREKYVYQEFVRGGHAKRIKRWIQNDSSLDLGYCVSQLKEVNLLLSKVNENVRDDVALLCESHHLSDISDTDQFEVSKPYGHTPHESANLQYCAVILRTVDLLHVTGERAPTIQFRIIDPKNPYSKREWLKQNAVTSIRPKPLTQDEIQAKKPQDTIEIRAEFKDPQAYFDLQRYISYLRSEIELCYEWIKRSKEKFGLNIKFEWRYIDASKISTRGFHPKQLSFTLDQNKILKLLTGQTLYNDISVSLRELIQNGLDAVKLNAHILSLSETPYAPRIDIFWDAESGVLQILDNGVGMSQDEIESYFLKAGSSKYQVPEFKKKYPNFSPIGRFGIGVLSCFMISDDVEVYTTTGRKDTVRNLKLSDAQSDYLVRDVDRNDLGAEKLSESGTLIKMLIRPSLRKYDFKQLVQKWIMFPYCEIIYHDEGGLERIGFNSTREAVQDLLTDQGYPLAKDNVPEEELVHGDMKIISHTEKGLDISYAVSWNKWGQQWEFVGYQQRQRNESVQLGTFVEGVFVSSGTPGYKNNVFIALANFTGENAPKTNVARSDFEITPELESSLMKIYSSYSEHVNKEIREMSNNKKVSLTQAATDARSMMNQLSESPSFQVVPIRTDLLKKAIREINGILLDNGEERTLVSINEVRKHSEIWTILWDMIDSVNYLSRNLYNSYSASKILKSLGDFPPIPDIVVPTTYLQDSGKINNVFSDRQISKVKIYSEIERVNISWTRSDGSDSSWINISDAGFRKLVNIVARTGNGRANKDKFLVIAPNSTIDISGGEKIKIVSSNDYYYIIRECKIADHLRELITQIEISTSETDINSAYIILSTYSSILMSDYSRIDRSELLDTLSRRIPYQNMEGTANRIMDSLIDLGEGVVYIGRRTKSFTSRFFGASWQ
ncbi:hypothetical protein GCM10017781_44700 [Deinococcus metalli]|nr:hypothetical protein GCM10017781_44700 [Deinococcus metalli]